MLYSVLNFKIYKLNTCALIIAQNHCNSKVFILSFLFLNIFTCLLSFKSKKNKDFHRDSTLINLFFKFFFIFLFFFLFLLLAIPDHQLFSCIYFNIYYRQSNTYNLLLHNYHQLHLYLTYIHMKITTKKSQRHSSLNFKVVHIAFAHLYKYRHCIKLNKEATQYFETKSFRVGMWVRWVKDLLYISNSFYCALFVQLRLSV